MNTKILLADSLVYGYCFSTAIMWVYSSLLHGQLYVYVLEPNIPILIAETLLFSAIGLYSLVKFMLNIKKIRKTRIKGGLLSH